MLGKIFIGSDHAGFELKKTLKAFLNDICYECEDVGASKYDKDDDYPDFAVKVCERVVAENGRGILVCGTGLGMDRAANKMPGIYASVCWNEDVARQSREHGDTNVLTLGASTVNSDTAKRIVSVWLETSFSNEERHARRKDKIREIERTHMNRRKGLL